MNTRFPHLTYHELLDQHRRSHGLSYGQLAERAWTTSSYVFRLCKGESRPGYTLVLRLAIAMALTVEETDELLRLAGYTPLLDFTNRNTSREAHALRLSQVA